MHKSTHKPRKPKIVYLAIKNWEKFQPTNKLRNKSAKLGWIKSYVNKEDDYDFCRLSMFDRAVLEGCQRLRMRTARNIRNDPDYIATALRVPSKQRHCIPQAIRKLVAFGFLILSNQQKPPGEGEGEGDGERDGEGEMRKEKDSSKPSLQKQANVLKTLPELCRKVLGIRPEPIKWRKEDLQELAKTYGGSAVVQAFEDWANAHEGEVVSKPLLEFIKVADGLLTGTVKLADPDVINLAAALMKAGGQTFTGKNLAALARLRRSYSADEIINAYAMFTKEKDEFQMKRAPSEFCEGGALQTFALLRDQAADAAKDKERLRILESQSRAESEQRKAQPQSPSADADETFETGL